MSAQSSLQYELLEASETEAPATLSACLNSRGLYNSMQFVLRLSPVVHDLVNDIVEGRDRSWEALQAYSTYLHETIHWWQHVGSTLGLVVSLSYPAQAHANIDYLKYIANSGAASKSIKLWAEIQMKGGLDHTDDGVFNANIAVNNSMDIEYFKFLIMRPDLVEQIAADPYFESVGHSFHMAYAHVVNLLSATCDSQFACLPNPTVWSQKFEDLGRSKVEGYYHGSPIGRPPIGLVAILEGQARFIQLQFLSFAADDHLSISHLRDDGYLAGVYGEAFDLFLRLIGSNEPKLIDDPLVGLFLLICDLSINPSSGFPLPINNYERFIYDSDPGIRFARLCRAVREVPHVRSRIRSYSREEYEEVSSELSGILGVAKPIDVLEVMASWITDASGIGGLMQEKDTFRYSVENLPVRVLFSHFLDFCSDKFRRPDFFCWAGAHMAGRRVTEEATQLWLKHLSLFSDKADDGGIFPRDIPGKDALAVKQTFEVFYTNNVIYDMTRQWILQEGPFKYDLSWLSQRHTSEELSDWSKQAFKHLYGIEPDAIAVI